ncbi:MAG: hypothetical protein DWI10_03250 [Planctomycetota bacterium]|nr:MAG: hypothetical protein DWI10_03250 [Planctomycetota bacterium]
MNTTPSVRSVREAIIDQARQTQRDDVAMDAMRNKVAACVHGVRRAIDRSSDFAARGLIGEAAALGDDFPDLARQADALCSLPTSDPAIARMWTEEIDIQGIAFPLPTRAEVDTLASYSSRAAQHRTLLDALRVSALRGEPLGARLRILRRLRVADERNRMWLDQIEILEQEWIKRIAELRHRTDVRREELDEALEALEANEWVASVPRGLKEEILAKVKPLRADEAVERYRMLAAEVHDAAGRMDREDLLRLEGAWALVYHETGRMPEESLAAGVATAFEWLTRLDAAEQALDAFNAITETLERMLLERRSVDDVARQIALLQDCALPAPEGLLDRARSYIADDAERVRRHHRVVLVSAVLGAIVLSVAGALAIRSHSESSRIASERESLHGHIEAGDASRAHALAEQIRAGGDVHEAQMLATLEREAVLFAQWSARSAEIDAMIEASVAELKTEITRARAAALQRILSDASSGASSPQLTALDAAERARLEKVALLDDAAHEAANTALATADAQLRAWALPDKWTDSEQLAPERWKEYQATLERVAQDLATVRQQIDGFDGGSARVEIRSEAVQSRLNEASSRFDTLNAALLDLRAEQLCRAVSIEQDFIVRLEAALTEHSGVLARQGRLADFEHAKDFGPAWISIGAWRDEYRPRLAVILGADLALTANAADAARACVLLQEFNANHPASPYRSRIDALISNLDPNAAAERWLPQRIALELGDERLANIEVVPITKGRRFYRRPSVDPAAPSVQMLPCNRALKNIADVLEDPEKLSSILAVSAREVVGQTKPSTISRAWSGAQSSLEEGKPYEASTILVQLLSKVSQASDEEPIFQLRALRIATAATLRSGNAPVQVELALRQWIASLKELAPDAELADWVRAGYDNSANFTTASKQAQEALKRFPDLQQASAHAATAQQTEAKFLVALAPVGVVAPAGATGGSREIVGSKYSGPLVIAVNSEGTVNFIDAVAANGAINTGGWELPKGPMIVFRRIP